MEWRKELNEALEKLKNMSAPPKNFQQSDFEEIFEISKLITKTIKYQCFEFCDRIRNLQGQSRSQEINVLKTVNRYQQALTLGAVRYKTKDPYKKDSISLSKTAYLNEDFLKQTLMTNINQFNNLIANKSKDVLEMDNQSESRYINIFNEFNIASYLEVNQTNLSSTNINADNTVEGSKSLHNFADQPNFEPDPDKESHSGIDQNSFHDTSFTSPVSKTEVEMTDMIQNTAVDQRKKGLLRMKSLFVGSDDENSSGLQIQKSFVNENPIQLSNSETITPNSNSVQMHEKSSYDQIEKSHKQINPCNQKSITSKYLDISEASSHESSIEKGNSDINQKIQQKTQLFEQYDEDFWNDILDKLAVEGEPKKEIL